MGFEDDDEQLLNGIFYKFSYPSWTVLFLDSMEYNGDTLFVQHGVVDFVGENKLGVKGKLSIPGESGSSLIKIKNEMFYTTYGVANFARDMVHYRMSNWIFYAFKHIIKDDLFLDTKPILPTDDLDVFPNPTHGKLYFSGFDESALLTLFDNYGNRLMVEKTFNSGDGLDISKYPCGIYFLNIKTETMTKSVKVVRY